MRRDRASVPVDELGHLTEEDRQARKVVDAFLKLRDEAGVERSEAVGEFVRETSYTWANRLLALRCMEARELIDSVILQQEAYAGRSLEHHRLAQRRPELCVGDDDGLFAVLDKVFHAQAGRLPMLFDPLAPGIALRPSAPALKDCFGLLSLSPDTLRKYRIRLFEDETATPGVKPPNPFTAPDALGWAYQYWNTEEKDRVFEKVRTIKGAKIAGADIIPATQLYTEDYMVKFLVQNSLGATWMGMHPESKLAENWEYFVKDADRAPVEKKPVGEITFLDPACGSGHFHLEAFDLFYAMYQEEGELTAPEEICNAILTKNLFGIDIDPRAVQIAEVALWMKAAERAFDYKGVPTNLVAATSSHLNGEAWEEFLDGFEKEPSVARVLRKFAQTMEHIDEIGSLARPADDLREIIEEEHATWERQVREQKEANFLFPEMNEDALRGQLPFQEISDEEFGDRLFYRAKAGIDAFTERARAAGEFEDQMLSSETLIGFRLLDLLSRRYDVVAANPPYMGSKGMGPVVKKHVGRYYKAGDSELGAAFILRCLDLTAERARVAMVTQQAWMFLKSFADLRAVDTEELRKLPKAAFRGLLRETMVESLAHLGPNAFAEISGEVVSTVMFVLAASVPQEDHRLTAFRLIGPKGPKEKADLLRQSLCSEKHPTKSRPEQKQFLDIPQAPLSYWLADLFLAAFATAAGGRVGDVAPIVLGVRTSNDHRFVRYIWEVNRGANWYPYQKGGNHVRWSGLNDRLVNWSANGVRIKCHIAEKYEYLNGNPGFLIRGEEQWPLCFITYTDNAGGSFCARVSETWSIPSDDSPCFAIARDDGLYLVSVLNSRVTTYLLRSISPSRFHFGKGYVEKIPLPLVDAGSRTTLHNLSCAATAVKRLINRDQITETVEPAPARSSFTVARRNEAMLSILEGCIDKCVTNASRLTASALNDVLEETGTPAAWFPLIAGYDDIREILDKSVDIPPAVEQSLPKHDRRMIDDGRMTALKNTLRSHYEAGQGANLEVGDEHLTNDEDEEEVIGVGARIAIPAETFLEELSLNLQIHPISVYWLLKEGVEKEGWRCLPEERRLWADRITVAILRLLGHRWPKQFEAREAVPESADSDGIILLSTLAKESTLFEHLQQRLRADEIDAEDFTEVMGKSLDAWLANELFKHHTKQFKKRPVAWQLQSSRFTAYTSPAFACVLYYHKLDADALPKLRKLAEDLRKTRETERRGILGVPADARSERQEKRRTELEDTIVELQLFDTTLEAVASTGFGPHALCPLLRQNAIDDAMLTLKGRWLRRLTELIAKSPLPDWLAAADRTELHPDLRVWVADAMAHLDYFCARVGPKAPDQSKLTSDPTAADLAKLITPRGKEMVKNTLELACDQWYSQFDEIVLGPDKDEIKMLKEEEKSCKEKLDAEPAPDAADVAELKYRVKEIQGDVKILTAKFKRNEALAKKVRAQIEGWRSKEPADWGEWLAGQPLFDRIASLDGRRAAPTTIADFIAQESLYAPDINDGVRVNIAPLQKAGLLAADVLAKKDLDKAIADRAEWRADERRWVREGKLPQPGWWPENVKQ